MTYNQQDELSDEALVARACAGDEAAFGQLVKRYEQRLFNYIRRIVGNAADAEDLFQDVFIRVYNNLHKFKAGKPFKPWLYRIATNRCRDHLRYRRRRPTKSLEDDGNNHPMAAQLASGNPSPRETAEAEELAQRLDWAIEQLPLKHRTVFVMARYESMPYDEIGKALRIPVGTVKSRMNKAVSVLMRELDIESP